MTNNFFAFKQFNVKQDKCAMKVGTDAVLLGAWVEPNSENFILDIGTGTGVIALMLAQKTNASIIGIDLDLTATQQARENVDESKFRDHIKIIHTSLQEYAISTDLKFEMIVSNPPFFQQSLKSIDEKRSNARHADVLPFDDLLNCVIKLLDETGKFCLVLPTLEADKFKNMAHKKGLYLSKLLRVKSRTDKDSDKRHLMQFQFKLNEFSENTLVIENEERHHYTNDYMELTKDYYLHF